MASRPTTRRPPPWSGCLPVVLIAVAAGCAPGVGGGSPKTRVPVVALAPLTNGRADRLPRVDYATDAPLRPDAVAARAVSGLSALRSLHLRGCRRADGPLDPSRLHTLQLEDTPVPTAGPAGHGLVGFAGALFIKGDAAGAVAGVLADAAPPALTHLELRGFGGMTIEAVERMRPALGGLTGLCLCDSGIDDAEARAILSSAPTLEELDLSGTRVTRGLAPDVLGRPGLRRVSVSRTRDGDAFEDALLDAGVRVLGDYGRVGPI